MADFLDAFGSGDPPEDTTPEIAPEAQPEVVAEAPTPEPTEPAAQVTAEPVATPERPEPGFVPIAAMMDERDKRKALEQRIATFEAQQQQAQRAPAPDPYDDQEGYTNYMQQELQSQLQKQKVDLSFAMSVDKHGEEAVIKARDWAIEKARTDPGFMATLDTQMAAQALPLEWIIQQHKRDGLYSQLPTDISSLDEYIEREIVKRGLTAVPVATIPVAAQQAPKPSAPPRSIASDTPSQAPVTPEGDKDSFLGIFGRK